jgi:hypothetical protein
MGVEKGDAFISHLLKTGRLDLSSGVCGRKIPNAKVICHDKNDIWQFLVSLARIRQASEQKTASRKTKENSVFHGARISDY